MDFRSLESERLSFGEYNDCGVKALSVCCEVDYRDALAALELAGRQPKGGTMRYMYNIALPLLDCEMEDVSDQFSSKTIRTLQRELDAKGDKSNYLISVRNHAVGVKAGKIIDWTEGRCYRILKISRVIKNVK
jgi:hypothetical protein